MVGPTRDVHRPLHVDKDNPDFAEVQLQGSDAYNRVLQDVVALLTFMAQTGIAGASVAGAIAKIGGLEAMTAAITLYYAWLKMDNSPYTGEARSEAFRHLVYWKILASYFPHTLVRTCRLQEHKRVIFGVHPHGIMMLSAAHFGGMNSNNFDALFPHIDLRVGMINAIFKTAIGREIALGGTGISADRRAVIANLEKGRSVALVVGGANEALLAGGEKMRLVLKDRLGFVKIAVQTGTALVPVLSFGENQTYNQVFSMNLRRIQQKMQTVMGFSLPLFYTSWGRGGVLPNRVPLNTVVGGAVEVTQCDEKDPRFHEVVLDTHRRYLEAIRVLHAKYAPIYGNARDQELEFMSVDDARDPFLAREIRARMSKL